MSSISLSQVGTSKTIRYSWSTTANTAYIFGIDGTQVESGHGDTSGSGTYTVDSYGSHSASLWVAHGSDPAEYITETITLVEPTPTTYDIGATLTYDANGGTGAPSDNVFRDRSSTEPSTNVSFSISYTIPTRDTYTFIEWKINGSSYNPGDVFVTTATTSLPVYTAIAQWEQIIYNIGYTLKFDANGGTGAPNSIVVSDTAYAPNVYKNTILPSTVPTRSGYKFLYWEIRNTYYSPGSTVSLEANTNKPTYTATAIWEELPKSAYIYANNKWNPAQPYIYATKDGVTKWWPATAYIYANSQWNPQ